MDQLSSKKRTRETSGESEINASEVKRLRENLLDDLYDSECYTPPIHDLDSFMKSFEEEIAALQSPVTVAGIGESQPELGYLLEASDDELGIPPPTEAETELATTELWGFEEQITNYDSFDLGIIESDSNSSSNNNYINGNIVGEYVGLDGLFDHSDLGFGSGDFLWRPETLPAQ